MSPVRNLKSIPPKRILIVDDEPQVANTIRLLLEMGGHTIEIAEDAERALAIYEPAKFDLVITDLSLPKMNGLDLARALRTLVATQPIILITAYAESIARDKERLANVNFLMGKPFSIEQLQDALTSIFPAA
ncbi:MAG: putative Histidine kinase [Pedosphaera sp.]|nr:putative Histidine kinase [Pedosphaera sp.]